MTYQPYHPVSAPGGRRRIPRWIAWVAAATAVASVLAFVTALLWPAEEGRVRDDPLAFHPFTFTTRIGYDHPSVTHLAAIDPQQDVGYVAWEQDARLRVRAFDLADGAQRWQVTLDGGSRWGRLIAAPGLLLVVAGGGNGSETRQLVVLRAADGQRAWERTVRGNDGMVFGEGFLALLDRSGPALLGLDPVTGEESWRRSLSDPEVEVGGVLTEEGLGAPTGRSGEALAVTYDHRLVLVTPDAAARVLDGRDGRVLAERADVATPSDLILAYRDRLYVARDEAGYEVVSYRLGELGAPPVIHYRGTDPSRWPDALLPCGVERLCLLDTHMFNASSREVVVVAPDEGREVWRHPAPHAERLLPVGDWVAVVSGNMAEHSLTIRDGQGELVLARDGLAARLNYGNLLVFEGALDEPEELRVTGIATAVGEPVDLGPAPPLTGPECVWNERYLLCAGRDAAEVWRFAETG